MEQLGCILLGFAFAAPAVFAIRAIISASEEGPWIAASQPPGRRRTAPLPRCDPEVAEAYFASLLSGAKPDAAQPLSVAELTALLAGPAGQASAAGVRFDSEGGYRLRL